MYGNQSEVGAAIAAALEDGTLARATSSSSPRNSCRATSLPRRSSPPSARRAALRCGSHVDLVLLQWPAPHVASIAEQWAAMEALVDAGLARDIGVSNFSAAKLDTRMDGGAESNGAFLAFGACRVEPSVNQIFCGAHLDKKILIRRRRTRRRRASVRPSRKRRPVRNRRRRRETQRSGPPPLKNPDLVVAAARADISRARGVTGGNVSRGVVADSEERRS